MNEQSTDFKHILITRFNLNLGWRDKSGNETLTDSWMSERFKLFEKFCVPSILNQSAKNFEWLVLFDLSTQLRYGKKIDEYSSGIPFFIPVFLSHPVDNEEIKYVIRSRLSDSEKFVISSRIDNDDAIHNDFLLAVQNSFNYQWDSFIRFTNGYQYLCKEKVLQRMYQTSGNHFTSRIENVIKGVDSVITVDNTKMDLVPNSNIIDIDLRNRRYWVEVVHENNVANHKRMLLPEYKKSVIDDFSVNFEINKQNRNRLMRKYLITTLRLDKIIREIKKTIFRLLKEPRIRQI